jgi:hypothetical protein
MSTSELYSDQKIDIVDTFQRKTNWETINGGVSSSGIIKKESTDKNMSIGGLM